MQIGIGDNLRQLYRVCAPPVAGSPFVKIVIGIPEKPPDLSKFGSPLQGWDIGPFPTQILEKLFVPAPVPIPG